MAGASKFSKMRLSFLCLGTIVVVIYACNSFVLYGKQSLARKIPDTEEKSPLDTFYLEQVTGPAISFSDPHPNGLQNDNIYGGKFTEYAATTHGGRGNESASGEGDEFSRLMKRGGQEYSEGHRRIYLGVITMLGGEDTLRRAVILEVGSGIGWGLQNMLQEISMAKYVGFEPCRKCIEYIDTEVVKRWKKQQNAHKSRLSAKKQALYLSPTIHLINEYFTDMDDVKVTSVLSGRADFSFCVEVAEHVEPTERLTLLTKLRKHTLHALFLSTPNKDTRPKDGALSAEQWGELLAIAGFSKVVWIEWQWTTLFFCQ